MEKKLKGELSFKDDLEPLENCPIQFSLDNRNSRYNYS